MYDSQNFVLVFDETGGNNIVNGNQNKIRMEADSKNKENGFIKIKECEHNKEKEHTFFI